MPSLYLDKIMEQFRRINEPTRSTTTSEMINPNMAQQQGGGGMDIGQILQMLLLTGAFKDPSGGTQGAGSLFGGGAGNTASDIMKIFNLLPK